MAFAVVGLGASAALRVLAQRFEERLRLAVTGAASATDAPSALWDVFWITCPLLAAAAAAAVIAGLSQTAGVVQLRRGPPRSSAGLWKGLACLEGAEPWASAGRAALTAAGLVAVALTVLGMGAADVAATTGNAKQALSLALQLVFRFFELSLAVLVASAALDVVIRRGAWLERWRLSPSEARREQRDAEGPEAVRSARRRAHEELLTNPPTE
jgi:flagellar biosynthesis protein FlhB